MSKRRIKISKEVALAYVRNYLAIALGCVVLAFGDAVFLTPTNTITGGVASVGVICNYYLEPIVGFDVNSIVVACVQVVLLLIGLLVLGKRFAVKTLFASLFYPAVYALFLGVHLGEAIGLSSFYEAATNATNPNTTYLMIASIFGGALAGVGVGFAYLGNGSTGGFDVISEIIAKWTEVKEGLSSFLIDAAIIIVGIVCMQNIINGLIGILGAFCCGVAIHFVYSYLSSFVVVDIISDKIDEIQDYIHKEMDHATTLIDTVGGYTGEKRKLIRVVVYHDETASLRSYIASVDPKAFVSFIEAQTINGEGFEPLKITTHKKGIKQLPVDRNIVEPDSEAVVKKHEELMRRKKHSLMDIHGKKPSDHLKNKE